MYLWNFQIKRRMHKSKVRQKNIVINGYLSWHVAINAIITNMLQIVSNADYLQQMVKTTNQNSDKKHKY